MRPSAPRYTLLLLLTGCSTAPGPVVPTPTPADAARTALTQEVTAVSGKAEALLRVQDELVWKSWTEGTPADLAKTYAGTEDWLTPATIASVDTLRLGTPDGLEHRALTHLHAYLVTEWLAQKTAELSEEAGKLEQTLTFGATGQEHPYRNLESLLAAERSALLRKSLYESATPAVTKLAEVLARRRARTEALLAELHLSSAALLVELREADLDTLVALANDVLSKTQSAFAATVARLSVTELQLPVERVGRADIPRLFRLPSEDAAFPKADIYGRATRTLAALGVDIAAMKNVTVDLKETAGKNPRGLVLGVVIPTDVRLSLLPVGGARDEREMLHQMGHVLSDGLSQQRRWALGKLGNRSVAEAWSFLMEDLTVDPLWLERLAGLTGDAQAAWRSSASAQRLFLLRRAAGKVLFNAAARAPGADVPALYRDVMARTYGFPMTAADLARSELDREEFLASADYLQAFVLAAQLEQQLRGRFGPTWWERKTAGDWMRGLLAPGNSVSASGLARTMGEHGLEVEAFLAKLPTSTGGAGRPPSSYRTTDGGMPPAASDAGAAPAPHGMDGGVFVAPPLGSDAGPPSFGPDLL
jgi:hypothetical protein